MGKRFLSQCFQRSSPITSGTDIVAGSRFSEAWPGLSSPRLTRCAWEPAKRSMTWDLSRVFSSGLLDSCGCFSRSLPSSAPGNSHSTTAGGHSPSPLASTRPVPANWGGRCRLRFLRFSGRYVVLLVVVTVFLTGIPDPLPVCRAAVDRGVGIDY